MEENREQPTIMPAPALNGAEETVAMSEVGSQETDNLGKFKSVQALMDAYDNLQAEFTKKCQLLSQIQKDKIEPIYDSIEEINKETIEDQLEQFLQENGEAKAYAEEIKEKFSAEEKTSPLEVAWAKVLLNHIKEQDKVNDPIINQYVLSDENVKNKILENYINDLSNNRPPLVMSSQTGERLSGLKPDSPKTLAEAKKLVDKMFS